MSTRHRAARAQDQRRHARPVLERLEDRLQPGEALFSYLLAPMGLASLGDVIEPTGEAGAPVAPHTPSVSRAGTAVGVGGSAPSATTVIGVVGNPPPAPASPAKAA